ncbi:AAA domain-containing protein [Streptomyces coeruleorubidus]|uniref:AAA domain-containing protein n=1 Tax=Streptomyces coeruleorubidus TaxID=116188 RepID=A0ABZ0KE00_STRC4|nr:AAA domain-containing protein [Streptomyces coeruleorubidus]WOT36189.1 AAA domain-containing protein [Streptomyces coeruleorubidus]
MSDGVSELVDKFVRYFCCDPKTAVHGPYEPPRGAQLDLSREELIPEQLFRYRLVDTEGRPVDVQIYVGITGVGGLLWEQEVRVLLRVGTTGQPGLPRILDGGFRSPEETSDAIDSGVLRGVAVAVTRGSSNTLADPEAVAYMHRHPKLSLRQFLRLAEALATLHGLGACHRNLWPGTIGATDQDPPDMWLARFEMSALMANLVQNSMIDAHGEGQKLRELYLSQPSRALAFAPKERLDFLFPDDGNAPVAEDERVDVYALAAVVWEWFFGPMPAELLPVEGESSPSPSERLTELNAHLIGRLRAERELPPQLTGLLERMLRWDHPRERPTAYEVVEELHREYERIVVTWDERVSSRPYLIGYMPEESRLTVYEWGWLAHSPETDTGRLELAGLIQRDLKGAKLLHSPHGAVPFVVGSERDQRPRAEARHLLVGSRALWFCTYYRPRLGWGGLGPELDEVLLIKYVVRRDQHSVRARLQSLLDQPLRRELPELEAVPTDMDTGEFDRVRADRPSWRPLVEAVGSARQVPDHEREYEAAIDWLLEYQGAELLARTYACEGPKDSPRTVTVSLDEDRDQTWVNGSALLTKYADMGFRPSLGDFFGSLEGDHGIPAAVEIVPDERGRPGSSRYAARALVKDRGGPDRVVLELTEESPPVPETGWIRPLDDRGSRIALERQVDGRLEMMNNPALLDQLRSPMSLRMLPYRWRRAGERLSGEDGKKAVQQLLTQEPFFALQGPPGTGKTTVAAEAIAHYLRVYPGHRVLVSAQSNFALDNLAERVLRRLDALDDLGESTHRWEGVALRVASPKAPVDPVLEPWRENRLAEERVDWIRRNLPRRLKGVGGDARGVLEEWRRMLEEDATDSVLPELGDRLRRTANLVFATCAMATAENVTPVGARSTMDWVIVEEAAKAWPTELAMPLCRGRRWTLIGDHKQLPAHRRDDVLRFLDSCVDDPDEEFRRIGASHDTYVRAFDLFRSLFEPPGDLPGQEGAGGASDVKRARSTSNKDKDGRPLLTLHTQYRMRDEISQVVSRVFYPAPGGRRLPDGLPPGLLTTGKEVAPVGLTAPEALAGRSLVWLDTHGEPDCQGLPRWFNAGEARVVQELVEAMRPAPVPLSAGEPGTTLAVLSPYRQQNRQLAKRGLERYLSTVHAFQGREADIVVVSLVRDRRPPGTETQPWLGLGHLTGPDLINVMLSRARQLLVLVGDFEHFAAFRPRSTEGEPGTAPRPDPEMAPRPVPATRPVPSPVPKPGPMPARSGTRDHDHEEAQAQEGRRRAQRPMADVGFWHQVCLAVELYGSRIPVADLISLRRSGPAADSAAGPVEP